MNLTLSQAFERTKDLAGEIKGAASVLAECEAKEADDLRLAEISGKATDRARERLFALYAERAALAERMKDLVGQVGETAAADDTPVKDDVERARASFDAYCDAVPSPFAGFGHPAQYPAEGAAKA